MNNILQHQLFLQKKNQDVYAAQIVGRNLCLNDSSMEFLAEYIDFCLDQIASNKDEASFFVEEARQMLSYYIDHGEMTEKNLAVLLNTKDKFYTSLEQINLKEKTLIEENNKSYINSIRAKWHVLLNDSFDLKGEKLLKEISEIDDKIDKDFLSGDVLKEYEVLAERIQSFISSRNKKKIAHKNRSALSDFKYAFDLFNEKSDYKKDESKLRSLLTTYIYKHNINELEHQVAIYYNFVYNHIFANVKDNLKYKMVEWSIQQ